MQPLMFITSSYKKFVEVKSLIPHLTQLDVDLPEIQSLDPHLIISEKIKAAYRYHTGEYIVEDTSLYFEALNGLPGPLIKWFMQSLNVAGIWQLLDKLGNYKACAKSILGYAKNQDCIYYFEGVIHGHIVAPRGEQSMSWDPIFQPDGLNKTFAEMTIMEKNQISMRNMAAQKLKAFLEDMI